jgi:hypothetical protein
MFNRLLAIVYCGKAKPRVHSLFEESKLRFISDTLNFWHSVFKNMKLTETKFSAILLFIYTGDFNLIGCSL